MNFNKLNQVSSKIDSPLIALLVIMNLIFYMETTVLTKEDHEILYLRPIPLLHWKKENNKKTLMPSIRDGVLRSGMLLYLHLILK